MFSPPQQSELVLSVHLDAVTNTENALIAVTHLWGSKARNQAALCNAGFPTKAGLDQSQSEAWEIKRGAGGHQRGGETGLGAKGEGSKKYKSAVTK